MEKESKTKQRALQISFGLGLIGLVFLIALLAVPPSGIHSYVQKGYKEFAIGLSKEKVLNRINNRKAIRTIMVCDPERLFKLTSRKGFEMGEDLAVSDFWICRDRIGKDFLFVFENGTLARILLQRLRFGEKPGSILFLQCNPEIFKDLDTYLTTGEKLKIFYDEK